MSGSGTLSLSVSDVVSDFTRCKWAYVGLDIMVYVGDDRVYKARGVSKCLKVGF